MGKSSQQSSSPKHEPSQKYLTHSKFILKQTKIFLKTKKEAIAFIKLDKSLIDQSLTCLKNIQPNQNSTSDLFSDQGFIYAEIDLAVVPEHYSIRPVRLPLPCPIYSEKYHSRFTIFSRDSEEPLTEKLHGLSIPQVAQVIGYEKIKKEYKDNKEKMKLLAANDLFFCDWKIYNLLRQPLGKLFYQKKKFPYPIDCEDVPEDLKDKYQTYQDYLNGLSDSTYLMLGNGPVYSLKIGRIDMSNPDLVKNVMRGIYRALPHIVGSEVSLDHVRQISLKTYQSPSLPIYSHLTKTEIAAYQKQGR